MEEEEGMDEIDEGLQFRNSTEGGGPHLLQYTLTSHQLPVTVGKPLNINFRQKKVTHLLFPAVSVRTKEKNLYSLKTFNSDRT
jgi:hypothetical protein